MKSRYSVLLYSVAPVAPLAGAWIEISEKVNTSEKNKVAPLAGAWIEIRLVAMIHTECSVAPLAGAWIEMVLQKHSFYPLDCRTPRGCVD